jgi:hypothetical protein
MSVKNSVAPILLTTLPATGFTGDYQLLSAVGGIPQAVQSLSITNGASLGITVSYDGINDHDYIPSLMIKDMYFQTNAQPNTSIAKLPKGTPVYVKAPAGTGTVALSGWYQVNS